MISIGNSSRHAEKILIGIQRIPQAEAGHCDDRHRRLTSNLRDGVESVDSGHEQIDDHHVKFRHLESVNAGMGA
jgi:hypothetical protein